MRVLARASVAGLISLALAPAAQAQEPKSAALAKQLAAALDAAKLDSVAAKLPAGSDTYVGALYFPGVQLLVVSARYTVPVLINEKLDKKAYRDVYIDLNSASVPESKVFITDLGCDGLKADRNENQPFDTYEAAGKPTIFDGDWKKQKLSKEEYMKVFGTADEQYTRLLEALLAQLKKTS